jgi:hypothetical protein
MNSPVKNNTGLYPDHHGCQPDDCRISLAADVTRIQAPFLHMDRIRFKHFAGPNVLLDI